MATSQPLGQPVRMLEGEGGGDGYNRDRLFAFKGHAVPSTPGRFMVQKVESYASTVINSSDTSIHWAGTETVFISKEPFVIYSVVALSFERYLTSSQARLVHLLVIFNKQDKVGAFIEVFAAYTDLFGGKFKGKGSYKIEQQVGVTLLTSVK